MTTTDVTESLLETYRKKSESKDFYNARDFRIELSRLLDKKYSPNSDLTLDQVKRLAEYDKYFTWEESYSIYFSTTFYVEHSPTLTVNIEDRDRYIELLGDEDITETLMDEIDYAVDDAKHNGDLDIYCDDTVFDEGSVSIYQFELKPEFKIATRQESINQFALIFNSLNSDQKKNFSSIPSIYIEGIFKQITEDWKKLENNS